MSTRHPSGAKSRRRGQAVVEFALVLPIFLMLLFGAVQFGLIFLRLHIMTTACRDGAREATLPGRSTSDVQSAVQTTLTTVGLDPDEFTITPVATDSSGNTRSDVSLAQAGDTVEVTLTHSYGLVVGALVPGLSDTITLEQSCTFSHE